MRKLYRAIVSLIAGVIFLVSGCGTRTCPVPPRLSLHGDPIVDVTVYVSPEFNERERDGIVNGILMWERATNGLMTWHLTPYDPKTVEKPGKKDNLEHRVVLFKKAASTDEWVKKWEEENNKDKDPKDHKSLLGLCQGDASKELTWLWLVEDRLSTSKSETIIAAHEFGHALGLDHVENKASVMSEFYNRDVDCLTVHDLHEFCQKRGCNALVTTTVCRPE